MFVCLIDSYPLKVCLFELIAFLFFCVIRFIFDVVFYAQGIFSDSVISAVNKQNNKQQEILDTSLKNVFLALGALPGYYVAVATINKIGRRNMQLQGFIVMGVIFFVMGFFWTNISNSGALFITLYALTFFFSNFGPNTTTFVLPVEVFPTAIRATCHGLAAAAGKIGATVGTSLFGSAQKIYGRSGTFIICAITSWLGAILTLFFTWDGPTHHKALNQSFFKNVSMYVCVLFFFSCFCVTFLKDIVGLFELFGYI